MRYFPDYRSSTLGDLQPGTFFAYPAPRGGGEAHFGLTVEPAHPTRPPSFLAISPGHEALKNRVGQYEPGVLGKNTVIAIPDAQIRLPVTREQIRLESFSLSYPAGSLVLVSGVDLCISAHIDVRQVRLFHLHTGVVTQAQGQPAWFTQWDVVIPNGDGSWTTLCSVEAEAEQRGAVWV